MIIKTVKTRAVHSGELGLKQLIDESIVSLQENCVVVITSKVVSLCEGRTLPIDSCDKDDLIKCQSDYYLPKEISAYGFTFTITNDLLIPTAGIDESNGNGNYILWPKNVQKTANEMRLYLAKKFNLKNVGVLITDSTCSPLKRGTTGIALAHSGFAALNNYVGKADIFGRQFQVSHSSVSGGLAAGAVVAMGEGSEQTPLAIVSDVSFVNFQHRNPNKKELTELRISKDEDLFAPFLNSVKWKIGGGDCAKNKD